jgi:hypothetical protein
MQILGLSESTPKPENWLKTLFWPRLRYAEDVDLLGAQGYWICVVLAGLSGIAGLIISRGFAALFGAAFFYLAGIGVRRASRFAAISVFVLYLLSLVAARMQVSPLGAVVSFFFFALLLSNVRATWLAKSFARDADPQQPDTSSAVGHSYFFSDVLPRLIWPIGKWLYYVLAVLMFIGLVASFFRAPRV